MGPMWKEFRHAHNAYVWHHYLGNDDITKVYYEPQLAESDDNVRAEFIREFMEDLQERARYLREHHAQAEKMIDAGEMIHLTDGKYIVKTKEQFQQLIKKYILEGMDGQVLVDVPVPEIEGWTEVWIGFTCDLEPDYSEGVRAKINWDTHLEAEDLEDYNCRYALISKFDMIKAIMATTKNPKED